MTQDGKDIRVPYGLSVHGEEEIEAVVEVLRTSTQMGPKVREFEQGVADQFSKKHGIMVNSGSSANFLAINLLGLQPGDEVITPVLTFATTVAPLLQHDLIPSFVDVEAGTYNIDVSQVEKMITPATKAMMIPSLIGNMPDWDELARIAKDHNLVLVEDSCDSLGATLRGTSTGTRSAISTTSFYGSHVINCAGNGGMLCVNDEDWNDRAKLLRSWGRSSSLFVESESIENRFNINLDGLDYDAKFVFSELGYNMEPAELGAAFGLVQLNKLEDNISARAQNFETQLQFFSGYEDWFVLPKQMPDSRTGWLAFALTLSSDAPFDRRELQIYLEKRNIQTRAVFTGNILRQPGFANIPCKKDPDGYPNADAVMKGGMLTACHHGLKTEHITHMQDCFTGFLKAYQ